MCSQIYMFLPLIYFSNQRDIIAITLCCTSHLIIYITSEYFFNKSHVPIQKNATMQISRRVAKFIYVTRQPNDRTRHSHNFYQNILEIQKHFTKQGMGCLIINSIRWYAVGSWEQLILLTGKIHHIHLCTHVCEKKRFEVKYVNCHVFIV